MALKALDSEEEEELVVQAEPLLPSPALLVVEASQSMTSLTLSPPADCISFLSLHALLHHPAADDKCAILIVTTFKKWLQSDWSVIGTLP